MIRVLLRALGWVALIALLVGAFGAYRIGWGTPFTIAQLADRQALAFVVKLPEGLTSIGAIDGTLLDRHSGRWSPSTLAFRDELYEDSERYRAELAKFDPAALKGQDRLTFLVLDDYYTAAAAYRAFDWLGADGLYPINQLQGVQKNIVDVLISLHKVKNEKTAETYIQRLYGVGQKLDEAVAEMNRQAALGVILPAVLFDVTGEGLRQVIEAPPADHPLAAGFAAQVEALKISEEKKTALKQEVVRAIETAVVPAFQRTLTAFEALRPQAPEDVGVWRLPQGEAFYNLRIKEQTTTDYTADQLFALGEAEVARIGAAMDAILRAKGLAEGTLGARVTAFASSPEQLFPNDDAGREAILARYREIIADMETRMPAFFATIPPQKVAVDRAPEATEDGGAVAYYMMPAFDGSRPGTFYANLADISMTPRFSMKSLAYHEAIPGHHHQIALTQNLKVPLIRRLSGYTAFTEGWALYAEALAAEMGVYEGDPEGDLGRLQLEMLRAVRLVVDTGMHAKRWNRAQAIQYMMDNAGLSEAEATSEIDRYIVDPGQALAYKVGMIKIQELRAKAAAALGPKFSIKAFHEALLGSGALPLTVLEQEIDAWIAQQKAAA